MDNNKHLRLIALDKEDLTVISACLQDAVANGSDFLYQPTKHRFIAIFKRFCWENGFNQDFSENNLMRIRTGIHFNSVISVHFKGISDFSKGVFELLAIDSKEGNMGSLMIYLEFAAGSSIRLEVECIDCSLSDIGQHWNVRNIPKHPIKKDFL